MESSEKKKAIELKDVCINYRILNATSLRCCVPLRVCFLPMAGRSI